MTRSNPENQSEATTKRPSTFSATDRRRCAHQKVRRRRVQTRFPPEPNGYLHIGHAKAICIDFGLADEFGGKTNLRFDDTNPEKEEQEYVDSIMEDVRWLGFEWDGFATPQTTSASSTSGRSS
jgi:glutaminyl-tRNA synthetase